MAHAAKSDKSDFHAVLPILSGWQSPHRRRYVQMCDESSCGCSRMAALEGLSEYNLQLYMGWTR
jgi:hypothetical protein